MSLTRTNVSLYPGAIDTDAQLEHIIDNVTEIEAKHFNNIKDAIVAIETTIGSSSTLQTVDLNTQLSNVEDGFFLKEGDVMWGDLNFKHQDFNRSSVPARLFLGNCNCVIGLDDREFLPGEIALNSDETAYVTYSPDVGSKFIPDSKEISEGVVSDGVVPLSIVGSLHNFDPLSVSGSLEWEDRGVSLDIGSHAQSRHRVKILDDLEVAGSLRVRNFLSVRGVRGYQGTNEWGATQSNDFDSNLLRNQNWFRHDSYSSGMVIVGTDSVEPPSPENALRSDRPSMLVTKNATVGRLFGGEYGVQFLGAKFWKSWQDMDLKAEQVAGFLLDPEESDEWSLQGAGEDEILKASLYSPGANSLEFNSLLASPLEIEIPYESIEYRDVGLDSQEENVLFGANHGLINGWPSSYGFGPGPWYPYDVNYGTQRNDIASGVKSTSKYKMFWITVTCEVEDPSSLVLLVGRRAGYSTGPTAPSHLRNHGITYSPIHQCYPERRSHGKENICSFSFLVNHAALQNFTVRADGFGGSELRGRAQFRPRYSPLSAGAAGLPRSSGSPDTVWIDPRRYPFAIADYGYLEPTFDQNFHSIYYLTGLSPIANSFFTRDNAVYESTFHTEVSDLDGTEPNVDTINVYHHISPTPSTNVLYAMRAEEDSITDMEHNVYSFTLRRHRVNKPYPESYVSNNSTLPIAENILDIDDDNINGGSPGGNATDKARREEIESLFADEMPEVKNILISIFAIDNLPCGQDSMDFDPGVIVTGDYEDSVLAHDVPKAYRWARDGSDPLSDNFHGVDKIRLSPRQFVGYSYYADNLEDYHGRSNVASERLKFDYRRIVRY